MKRFNIYSQPAMALALSAMLGFSISAASAERIFYESFEVADANGDPVGWQTAGHPNYLGVANENNSTWSTPYGERAMTTYSTGVGTKPITFLPEESGEYSVKFNISSNASKGEYRAELWAIPWFGQPILLASTAGDTNGSKDMSFLDQLTWRYDYEFGSMIDGAELQLKLMQDPLRADWRNTPVWDNVSVDFTSDFDTSPPIIVDIVDDKDGGTIAPNTLVTYRVSFNEDMDASTVGPEDFGNASSAPVLIGTVTETEPTSGVFIVEVTPTAGGSLRLQINENAVLKDAVGNAMNTFNAEQDNVTLIVEGTKPILVPSGFVDNRAGAPVAPNTTVTYNVTFSKDMNAATVSASDFGNAGSAPATIGAVTETTATSGVFTVQATPTGAGTLQLRVNAGADLNDTLGNSLDTSSEIADNTTIAVDSTVPTLGGTDILDDREGSPVAPGRPVIYSLVFSENMDPSTVDASDFANDGTAPIIIGGIAAISPEVFSVEVTPSGEGTLRLRVNSLAIIKDRAGNALDTTSDIMDDTVITVGGLAPSLAGSDIVDDRGGLPVAPNTLVVYTVTFSGDMDESTVTSADFDNAGTSPVNFGAVTEVSPGVFTVRATPTAVGTLRLQVKSGALLKDAAGISMDTTSAIGDDTTITVESTPPTLAGTDMVDNKGGGTVAANIPVTYTVTFSEDMDASTVEAADFGNAGSAPFTIGAVTETAPTSGIFTVQATPTGSGTLRLRVNVSAILRDAAGNALNTTSAIVDDTTITVDGTVPTLAGTGIVDDKGGVPILPNTLVTYTVSFSKDMDESTVTAADFGNAGTSPVTIGAINETTPGVFTVEATPTGGGTLRLGVNAAALLTDVAGNPLNTNTAIEDNTTITVDGTAPTLAGTNIVDNKGGGMIIPNTLVTYTVTFSENMDENTVTADDFGNSGTAPVTVGTVIETSPGVFAVEVTPTAAGTLLLRINTSAELKDAVGNALDTVSAIEDNTTIIVDGTAPTLAGVNIVDDKGGATVAANALVTYTVTFSKDMDATTVTAAGFGNAGTATVTIGAVTETAPTSGVFTVQATPTNGGSLQLKVNAGAVMKDAPGNALDTASAIADDTTITVDGTTPTLAGVNIADDHGGGTINPDTLVTYTVTFSEDMDESTVTAADFGNAGTSPVTIGAVSESLPGVFSVEATPSAAGTLRLRINVSAVLSDVAGNSLNTVAAIEDDTTITVSAPASNPFDTWSEGAPFDGDTNGDGVRNGLAWVLGALDADTGALALLPTVDAKSDPAYLIYTFRRTDEANGDPNTTIAVEHGTALTTIGWTTAVHDNDNVIITVTDNHYSITPGIDRVVVKLKRATLASGGKLFTRLRVVQAAP
jgi:hypothetical protein